MKRNYYDDDDFDENGLLKDRHSVKVKLTMMDSAVQRSVAKHAVRITDARADAAQYWRDNRDCLLIHDGTSDPRFVWNKPGYRLLDNNFGQTAKQRAYDQYHDDLVNAYKNPPTGFGSQGSSTGLGMQLVGSPCTKNGFPGVTRRGANGEIYCDITASAGRSDAADARRRVRYEEPDEDEDVDEAISNASTHTESSQPRRRVDAASVAQQIRDHQNQMADIYDKLDQELSEKWRQS